MSQFPYVLVQRGNLRVVMLSEKEWAVEEREDDAMGEPSWSMVAEDNPLVDATDMLVQALRIKADMP